MIYFIRNLYFMIYCYVRTLNFLTNRMKALLLYFLLFVGMSNMSLDPASARFWSTYIFLLRGPRRPLLSYLYPESSLNTTGMNRTSTTSVSSFNEISKNSSDPYSDASDKTYKELSTNESPLLCTIVNTFDAHRKEKSL
jgi:hypothetical protein